jgi:aerobic C4-dicarboxylate transport protein
MVKVEPSETVARPRFHRSMHGQVLAAILLGIIVGVADPALGTALKPLGDAFIKLVKMVIAPVIFLTVTTGIAGMGELKAFGRVAAKAFGYFLALSTLALVIGLAVALIVQPGSGMHIDPATLDKKAIADYVEQAHDQSVTGFLMALIPTTMLSALTDGSILQTLFLAVLTGVALSLVGPRGQPITDLLERIALVVFKIVGILMRAAPVGAFGAMAFTIGKYGVKVLLNLGALVGCYFLTAFLFVAIVLGLVARLSGFSIWALLRYLKAELLLVLGTSSSEAALPSLIHKME